ncbi:hemoglobin subunit zeta [Amia ocellicauda]|uniref:hemoglobin subunit zeta n=1 Tax=Amia ocellicauda TaxID=2972642 RepID=UPI003463BE11|nr:HBAD protein [Amia calva]
MLTQEDKNLLVSISESIAADAEEIGAESLLRMFTCYPKTKTYFAHLDISPGSAHLRSHGRKIILAIGEGARNVNTLTTALAPLSALHAYQLMIHPTNFKLLSHCILVTLACHRPQEFTEVAHGAWDKFLSAVSAVLSEKYR